METKNKILKITISDFKPENKYLPNIEISSKINDLTFDQTIKYPFASPISYIISNYEELNKVLLSFKINESVFVEEKNEFEIEIKPAFFNKKRTMEIPCKLTYEKKEKNEEQQTLNIDCQIKINFSEETKIKNSINKNNNNNLNEAAEKKNETTIKVEKNKINKSYTKTESKQIPLKTDINNKKTDSEKTRKKTPLKKSKTKLNNYNSYTILSNNSSHNTLKKNNSKLVSLSTEKNKKKLNLILSPQNRKLRALNISKEKDSKLNLTSFTETYPKTAEDFLSIPATTIFDNISGTCKRCDILERLVSALKSDVTALQNHISSYIKNSKNDSKIKEIELQSSEIYNFPEFGLLFPFGIKQYDSPKRRKSNLLKKSSDSFSKFKTDSPSRVRTETPVRSHFESPNIIKPESPLRRTLTLEKRRSECSINLSDMNMTTNSGVNINDSRAVKVERYQQEIDSLMLKVKAYEDKEKNKENVLEQNKILNEKIQKLIINKMDFEERYKTLLNSANKKIEELTLDLEKKTSENNKLKQNNIILTSKNKEILCDLNKKDIEIKLAKSEANYQKINKDFYDNYNISKNTTLLEQKKKIDRNEEINKIIEDMKSKLETYKFEITKLTSENKRILQKNKDLENTINNKNKEISEKLQNITELELQLTISKAEQYNIKDLIKQKEDLKCNYNKLLNANNSMKNSIELVRKTFIEQIDNLNSKIKSLEKENENIRFTSNQFPIVINEKANEIEKLIIQNAKLNLELNDIKSRQQVSDIEKINSDVIKDVLTRVFSFNNKLLNDSTNMSDYLIMSSDKFKQANIYIKALIKAMTQKKSETEVSMKTIKENLNDMTEDVQTEIKNERNVHYSPNKNDILDVKLAEAINTYPYYTLIKNKFTKVYDNSYTYGNKKITINTKQDGLHIYYNNNIYSFDEFIKKFGE